MGFLPADFENRMKVLLGDEYDFFIASYERPRHRGLRVNSLKKNMDGTTAAEEYGKNPDYQSRHIPWYTDGYYYEEAEEPGKKPAHEAGLYYIQEPSAMAPVSILSPRPGERILDLCAAPGGKSTQLSAALSGEGLLVSNEINPARARILSENMERMGVRNAVVTNESPDSLMKRFEGFFDAILVDAPCSGEGMFVKNEIALDEWSLDNVKLCADRQAHILDCAAAMLGSSGRIVYSTCTFSPEENEKCIAAFLKRHPDFSLGDISEIKKTIGEGCDGNPAWCENTDEAKALGIDKTLRLWPHKISGEGHFAALLLRNESDEKKPSPLLPTSDSDMKKCREYLGDILKESCFDTQKGILSNGRLESFGDTLYLVPQTMPALKGLKVLRPGLALGMLLKNRFEPAHALALALDPSDAKNVTDLECSKAAEYIKGLTWTEDGEKGWHLICLNGYSLGWGKLAGGSMKNHYPKGLRKG